MNTRVIFLLSLSCLGCGEKPGLSEVNFRHNKDGKGTQIARFGDDAVTAEELKQRFAEMSPYARARYQTLEQKKEYVDGLARFEMLAAEAVRRGLANDPEVVETAKKVMVQLLLKKELEEKPTPVPDTTVHEYYQKHRSDYVKPEMIRLSHVFLEAPAQDPKRAALRAKAESILAKAKALQPMDYQAFATLVRESSAEMRTKPLDGDMRFLSIEELGTQYGPEVAAAGQKLTQVGQVADSVVETDKGYHVLKLQGRQAALNLEVDQVKTQIQNVLMHERKMDNYQVLLDSLTKTQGYKIDDDALSKLEVDMKAPAAEQKGPAPGFIPAPAQQAPRQ